MRKKKQKEIVTVAVKLSEHLNTKEQAFFVAGFQEAIKYLTIKRRVNE